MSELKIDDATPDTNVQGNELIPVSDNGTPKSVKVEQVKDYTLEQAAAKAAATAVTLDSDGVFIRQGGELRPVSAATFAKAVLASAFSADAAPADSLSDFAPTFVARSNGVDVTITADALLEYIADNITDFAVPKDHITNLDATDDLGDETEFPVSAPAGTDKKTTLEAIKNFILPLLDAYTSATFADGDSVLVRRADGSLQFVPKADFPYGNVSDFPYTSSSSLDWPIAVMSVNDKFVCPKYSVANELPASGASRDHEIPTAGAVRNLINAQGFVKKTSATITAGNLATWESAGTLGQSSYGVDSEITTTDGSSGKIPTSNAVTNYVKDRISNMTDSYAKLGTGSDSPTAGRIPAWTDTSGTLSRGYNVLTSFDVANSANAINAIPTVGAVANAIGGMVSIYTSGPGGGSKGCPTGALVFDKTSKNLYVNVGTVDSSVWMAVSAS